MQGANACVMRITTVWCARTHELAILHMHAKLLTKRKVYLRETATSLRGGRVVVLVCITPFQPFRHGLRRVTVLAAPRESAACGHEIALGMAIS